MLEDESTPAKTQGEGNHARRALLAVTLVLTVVLSSIVSGVAVGVTAEATTAATTTATTVSVNGTINGSGAVADDELAWRGIEGTNQSVTAHTNGTGWYETRLEDGGEYAVLFRQDNRSTANDTAYPDDGIPDVYALTPYYSASANETRDFSLPEASDLNVSVVDGSGAAIENATVTVVHNDGSTYPELSASTNANGVAVHPESDGPGFDVHGDVIVHVEGPNGTYLAKTEKLWNVGSDTSMTVTLYQSVTVNGQVRTANGQAVPESTLQWENYDVDQRTDNVTDPAGRYTVDLVKGVPYTLAYQQDDTSNHSDVAYPKDGIVDLYAFGTPTYTADGTDNWTLPAANNLTVSVVNASGAALSDVGVSLSHRNGEAWAYANGKTNSNGDLVLSDSPTSGVEANGSIRVRVTAPAGYADERTELTVLSDRHLQIELERTVNLTGRLVGRDGASASPGTVAFDSDAGYEESVLAADGSFSVRAAQNTTYGASFEQRDDDTSTADYPVDDVADIYAFGTVSTGGSDTDLGNGTVPVGHRLNVTVVNESGAPVRDAGVEVYHEHRGERYVSARASGTTNGNGSLVLNGATGTGIEVNGTVDLRVDPSSQTLGSKFVEATVTDDTSLTVQLPDLVNVTGQVVEPDGTPAADNTVEWQGRDGTEHWQEATTNAQGGFESTLHEGGTYGVAYYQADRSSGTTVAYPKDGVVDLYAVGTQTYNDSTGIGGGVPVGHNLTVTVVNASGVPVPDAEFSVRHENGRAVADVHGTANGNGSLVLEGSPEPGVEVNGTVTVRAHLETSSGHVSTGTEVTVTNESHVTLELPALVSVSGTVTEADGTPAAGDTLEWRGTAETEDWQEATTDAQGAYETALTKGGSYEVTYRQDDHSTTSDDAYPKDGTVDFYALGTRTYSESGTQNVSLPEGNNLTVRVVNASGEPLSGVNVYVGHENGDSDAHAEGLTNTDGSLVLEGSSEPGVEVNGTVTIYAEGTNGYSDAYVERTVTNSTTVTLTVYESLEVTGRFVYADGTAAANARVSLSGDSGGDVATTDADGRFTLSVSQDGEYDLRFRQASPQPADGNPDVYPVGTVSLGSERLTLGEVQLPAAHPVNVTVENATGSPVENLSARVSHRSNGAWVSVPGTTDRDGDVVFEDHDRPGIELAGETTVRVFPSAERNLSGNVSRVSVTGPTTVDVTVYPTASVDGQVVNASQTPISGRTVQAFASFGPQLIGQNNTDDQGRFAVGVLENRTTDIAYYQAGQSTAQAFPRDGQVDVYALDRVRSGGGDVGTYQVPDGDVLNVTVRGPDGTAVEDARVSVTHIDTETNATAPIGGPINADGMFQLDGHDRAGVEVTGTVNVTAHPPQGSPLRANHSVITVTESRNVTVRLRAPITVDGSLTTARGTPASNDTVVALRDGSVATGNLTDAEGRFTLPVTADATYLLGYVQRAAENRSGPPGTDDGTVDIWPLETVTPTDSTSLDPAQLPTGHVVNVTVQNESGAAVSNAAVRFGIENSRTDTRLRTPAFATASDGLVYSGDGTPGLELAGNVTVSVTPPPSGEYVDDTYTRTLTNVTAGRTPTITLAEQTGEPDIDVQPADEVAFPTTVVDTSSRELLQVANAGDTTLSVSNVSLAGADADAFHVVAGDAPFDVAPGEVRNVTVEFTPASTGTKHADLTIESDDPGTSTYAVALTADATASSDSGSGGDGDSSSDHGVTGLTASNPSGSNVSITVTANESLSSFSVDVRSSDGSTALTLSADGFENVSSNGVFEYAATADVHDSDTYTVNLTTVEGTAVGVTTTVDVAGDAGDGSGGGSANVSLTDATVDRTEVDVGEQFNVSVTFANDGNADGSVLATLAVGDGYSEKRTVNVSAGETVTERFGVTLSESGTYSVTVNDARAGTVSVNAATTETTTATTTPGETTAFGGAPGFTPVIGVVALAGAVLLARRR